MGFDREVTNYSCGCYYQYLSHDFFNYKKDHRFVNVCSKHQNLSRWLLLETNKDEIDAMFMKSLSGEEAQGYTLHLGGGVNVTADPKFPTVDI